MEIWKLLILFFIFSTYAQNTNSQTLWIPNGNVGTGTSATNVGIGINPAVQKLDVNGNANIRGYIQFNTNGYPNIWMDNNNSMINFSVGPYASVVKMSSTSVSITNNLTASGTITAANFSGNGSGLSNAAGWIKSGSNIYHNGYVGIGISSPSYKLHVGGDVYANWYRASGTSGLYFESYGGGFYMEDATWVRTYSQKSIWTGNGYLGSNGGLTIGYGGTAPSAGGAYIAGSVGIGTTNLQGYKLAVNGGIIAEEVKVITDVPASDYVFEENYKPASLTEVEQYVKTHKHLPGIPSAEEFKKNGYSVGQMDNMLLKQVEEMTLHLIALEKENKRLATEVEQLKNK